MSRLRRLISLVDNRWLRRTLGTEQGAPVGAPSLSSVVILVVTFAALAAALDKFALRSHLDSWRQSVADLWRKLNTEGARELAQDANTLYCDLFDHIYGKSAFSRRRVRTSSATSLLALLVVTLLLGYQNTFFAVRFEHLNQALAIISIWHRLAIYAVLVLLLFSFLNLLPDFVSVMGTRLVLDWSKGKGPLGISLLMILDLVLTTIVFYVVFALLMITLAIGVFGIVALLGGPPVTQGLRGLWENWTTPSSLFTLLLAAENFLVFFLTTFVTSVFWILFLTTFGVIWLFHRVSPLAKFVYEAIGRSHNPALTLSACLNFLVLVAYAIWVVLDKLLAT